MLDKAGAKKLKQGSFIPANRIIQMLKSSTEKRDSDVDINTLEFRPTRDDEVYQCCAQVCRDPQSGPMYCGEIAEYIAFVNDGTGNILGEFGLCGCRGHMPPKNSQPAIKEA